LKPSHLGYPPSRQAERPRSHTHRSHTHCTDRTHTDRTHTDRTHTDRTHTDRTHIVHVCQACKKRCSLRLQVFMCMFFFGVLPHSPRTATSTMLAARQHPCSLMIRLSKDDVSRLLQCNHVSRLLQCNHVSRLLQCNHVSRLLQCNHVLRLLQCNHVSRLLRNETAA